MRRLFLVTTFLAGLAAATANAQDGSCPPYQPPTPDAIAAMDPADQRATMIEGAEAALCHWTRKEPAEPRYAPPGAEAFWNGLRTTLEANMRLIRSRESVPSYAKFSARFQKPGFGEAWMNVITYTQLTRDIHHEDTCTGFKNPYCVYNTTLTRIEEQGKDGRAEAERLAATRVPTYDPWFVLGKVSVEVAGTRDHERSELRADRMLAQEAYARASDTVDDRKAALERQKARHAERRKAIYALTDELAAEIAQIEGQDLDDPEAEARAAARRALDARIDRLYDRREAIDRALESLHTDYPADDAFAQNRIAALNAELGEIDSREATLTDRMEALPEARRDPETQARLDGLKARHRAAKEAADSAMRIEDEVLERAEQALRDAETARAAAEEAMMVIDDKIARTRPTRTARVLSVHTDDAELRLSPPQEMAAKIALMNAAIRQLRAEKRIAHDRREAARAEMIDQARVADLASDALGSAIVKSYGSQALVETLFGAIDIIESAKGGPAAVVVEFVQQVAGNVTFPPTYHRADNGQLRDYIGGKTVPRPHELEDVYSADFAESEFVEELVKAIAATPGSALKSVLTLNELNVENLASAKRPNRLLYAIAASGDLSPASRSILKQTGKEAFRKRVKAVDDFESRFGQKGVGGMAKSFGKDLGLALGKGVLRESMKGQLAEIIEGAAFDSYMRAQADMHFRVLKFRALGDHYWQLSDELDRLRKARDLLVETYDPKEGTVAVRNLAFYADPGYALRLTFEEGARASGLQARVYLGGIALERQGTMPVWAVPASAAGQLTIDTHERLPVRIVFD